MNIQSAAGPGARYTPTTARASAAEFAELITCPVSEDGPLHPGDGLSPDRRRSSDRLLARQGFSAVTDRSTGDYRLTLLRKTD
jgi:hypothetical protein